MSAKHYFRYLESANEIFVDGALGPLNSVAPAVATGTLQKLRFPGGNRNINFSYGGINTLQYKINAGAFTTFTGANIIWTPGNDMTLRFQNPTLVESGTFNLLDADFGNKIVQVISFAIT